MHVHMTAGCCKLLTTLHSALLNYHIHLHYVSILARMCASLQHPAMLAMCMGVLRVLQYSSVARVECSKQLCRLAPGVAACQPCNSAPTPTLDAASIVICSRYLDMCGHLSWTAGRLQSMGY